jgi:hypothetical protein
LRKADAADEARGNLALRRRQLEDANARQTEKDKQFMRTFTGNRRNQSKNNDSDDNQKLLDL